MKSLACVAPNSLKMWSLTFRYVPLPCSSVSSDISCWVMMIKVEFSRNLKLFRLRKNMPQRNSTTLLHCMREWNTHRTAAVFPESFDGVSRGRFVWVLWCDVVLLLCDISTDSLPLDDDDENINGGMFSLWNWCVCLSPTGVLNLNSWDIGEYRFLLTSLYALWLLFLESLFVTALVLIDCDKPPFGFIKLPYGRAIIVISRWVTERFSYNPFPSRLLFFLFGFNPFFLFFLWFHLHFIHNLINPTYFIICLYN